MYGRKTRAKISSTEVEDIHFYIDKVNLVVLNTCTRNNRSRIQHCPCSLKIWLLYLELYK